MHAGPLTLAARAPDERRSRRRRRQPRAQHLRQN